MNAKLSPPCQGTIICPGCQRHEPLEAGHLRRMLAYLSEHSTCRPIFAEIIFFGICQECWNFEVMDPPDGRRAV